MHFTAAIISEQKKGVSTLACINTLRALCNHPKTIFDKIYGYVKENSCPGMSEVRRSSARSIAPWPAAVQPVLKGFLVPGGVRALVPGRVPRETPGLRRPGRVLRQIPHSGPPAALPPLTDEGPHRCGLELHVVPRPYPEHVSRPPVPRPPARRLRQPEQANEAGDPPPAPMLE